MASLLENMLQPASSIRAQALQTPQAQPAPHPQDSNAFKDVLGAASTAASIIGAFVPPAAPVAAGIQGANVAANLL